jgi:hypothetical protein
MRSALGRFVATVGLVVLAALVSSADPAGARHAPAKMESTKAAHAAGTGFRFDGGTTSQRSQVRAALRASSFDWSVVPAVVTVHIVRGLDSSEAAPGEIWLDADLLDSGTFAWGVVQHEYAHQVDFFALDDRARALFLRELGGVDWWSGAGVVRHSDAASERFASTLAWAYWPSRLNAMSPANAGIESGSIAAPRFRSLLAGVLAQRVNG